MITFYCPACWSEVSEKARVCPACGADIGELSANRDYIEKLIAALAHPEPTTPIRAAAILGRLKAHQAVEPLVNVLRGPADPYLKTAAAEALGAIGAGEAREALTELATAGPAVARRAAANALAQLSADPPRR